jgi:CO dehydrogenase maturation factor
MEAGIEHLTRGTTEGMDAFIVVVEPGQRSIQTAVTVKGLAEGLGIKKVYVVGNKVRNEKDEEFIKKHLGDTIYLGKMSFNESIMEADIKGLPSFKASQQCIDEANAIKTTLEKTV